jgi:hypothetical protein
MDGWSQSALLVEAIDSEQNHFVGYLGSGSGTAKPSNESESILPANDEVDYSWKFSVGNLEGVNRLYKNNSPTT